MRNSLSCFEVWSGRVQQKCVIRTLPGVSSLCIKHAVALIFRFSGLAVHARMRRICNQGVTRLEALYTEFFSVQHSMGRVGLGRILGFCSRIGSRPNCGGSGRALKIGLQEHSAQGQDQGLKFRHQA